MHIKPTDKCFCYINLTQMNVIFSFYKYRAQMLEKVSLQLGGCMFKHQNLGGKIEAPTSESLSFT